LKGLCQKRDVSARSPEECHDYIWHDILRTIATDNDPSIATEPRIEWHTRLSLHNARFNHDRLEFNLVFRWQSQVRLMVVTCDTTGTMLAGWGGEWTDTALEGNSWYELVKPEPPKPVTDLDFNPPLS